MCRGDLHKTRGPLLYSMFVPVDEGSAPAEIRQDLRSCYSRHPQSRDREIPPVGWPKAAMMKRIIPSSSNWEKQRKPVSHSWVHDRLRSGGDNDTKVEVVRFGCGRCARV